MKKCIIVIPLILSLLQIRLESSQNRYILECKQSLIDKSREVLYNQVGVREVGNNSGQRVAEYLRSVGLGIGNPYCYAGQYYCFFESSKLLNLPIESIPIPKTGLANNVFDYAQKRGLKTKYGAFIDDLIVWKYDKKISGHVERCISKSSPTGNVKTIGFNTGDGDQREGQGVFIKTRNIKTRLGRMMVRGLVGFYGK